MRQLKCCLLFSLLFFGQHLWGQNNVSSLKVDLQEQTPKSPNAGSLGKYFDIPVNMATGIPSISIPLYSIQTGNISVPIVLTYHAGGVKVDDIASWVGLGWSINASGTVNKKVNGLDDFYATNGVGSGSPNQDYRTPYYNNLTYNPGYTTMTEAIEGLIASTGSPSALDSNYRFISRVLFGHLDAEADEFYYSMPGGAGKFYYNQALSEFQTSKVDGTMVGGDANGFIIVTKDGKIYEFDVAERTLNPSYIKSLSSQQYLNTAWYLSNITDPSTGKQVSFSYDNYYKNNIWTGVYRKHDYDFTSGPPVNFGTYSSDSYRSGDNYVLSTITFDKGSVQFIKDTTKRLDSAANALREIRIYNNRNLLLKKYVFDYFYHYADSSLGELCCPQYFRNRLFLSSLQEIEYNEAGNGQVKPAYKFTYDTATFLPQRLSFAQDKWGYSNGKTANTTPIPSHPGAGTYPILVDADRNVDSNYTRAGTLTGIVYPTGGKTSFEFENNRDANNALTGGLRVKRVTHADSVTQKNLVTEYKYVSPGGSSTGQVWSNPVFNYDLYHLSGHINPGFTYRYIFRTESTPSNPLFPNQGSPVFYSMVEKREKSAEGDIMSRHYNLRSLEAGTTWTNLMSVPHPKPLDVNDLIEHTTDLYKRRADGNYELIQSSIANYGTLQNSQRAIWNAQGAWTFLGEAFSEWPSGDPTTITPMYQWIAPSIHAYQVMPSMSVRSDQYVKTISNNDTLTVYSKFEYDGNNGNVTKSYSVDSYGDTTIVMTKYASDYISASSPTANYEIKALRDQNMMAAPIEVITMLKKKDSVNSTVQGAVFLEYEGLKVKKIYRVYEDVPYNSFVISHNDGSGFYKDSHYQLFQEITAWDSEGRPRTVISNSNVASYIWDEKYNKPTAVVKNAGYADVAYTSFEGQSDGTWAVGSSTRDSASSITGRRSYPLGSGNITKSGLTSGTTYIVSYWNTNGSSSSFTVSGTSNVKEGRTSNGWTYYEHTISGVSSVTVSGAGYIDELRIYPKSAQMLSYCYEELLGMTAECDVANRVSYFEYYGPDKLKLVRDQDKKIVKKYCYNFAGQPDTDCKTIYYNVAATGNFTRNNCPAYHAGSTVTYTVEDSTYSSIISQAYVDSLAAVNVAANGQNYANTNGACNPTCTAGSCSSEGFKCVYGQCEYGVQVATDCVYDDLQGTWTITYHYEWSDGSWSQDYIIYNADSSWCG